VFTSNIPTLLIKEKSSGKVLFSVVLKGQTALNTTISNSAVWGQKKLNDGYGQTFTNGVCVTDKQNQCQIYIGTQGAIRIPDTYKNDFVGTYTYTEGAITIIFYDRNGTEVATTRFIPQPLP